MAGAMGLTGMEEIDRMTLRELLWLYAGRQYQAWMLTGAIVAGQYNVHRSKPSDKVWTFVDFHPSHNQARQQQKTGRQKVSKTLGWFAAGDVQWLEGYGPENLYGGQ